MNYTHFLLIYKCGVPGSNFYTLRGGHQAVHLHFNSCFEFLSGNKKIKANQSFVTRSKLGCVGGRGIDILVPVIRLVVSFA